MDAANGQKRPNFSGDNRFRTFSPHLEFSRPDNCVGNFRSTVGSAPSKLRPNPLAGSLEMRTILGINLSLALIGLLVYRINFSDQPSVDHAMQTQWRHTTDGWEKASTLLDGIPAASNLSEIWNVRLHPLVLSLLIALFSTLLLVAFSPESTLKRLKRRPSTLIAEIPLRSTVYPTVNRLAAYRLKQRR